MPVRNNLRKSLDGYRERLSRWYGITYAVMTIHGARGPPFIRTAIILRAYRPQVRYDDEDEDEGPQPDPMFEQGAPIPVRLHNEFPPELSSTPLEDIDNFYTNQRVPTVDALIN